MFLHLPSILLHAPSLSLPRKRGRKCTEYAALNCFKQKRTRFSPWQGLSAADLFAVRRRRWFVSLNPRCAVATRSSNLGEVAVPAEASLEAARTGDTVRDQRFTPIIPFLNQRLAHAEPVTAD